MDYPPEFYNENNRRYQSHRQVAPVPSHDDGASRAEAADIYTQLRHIVGARKMDSGETVYKDHTTR